MLKPSQMVDTYYMGDYFGDALKTKGTQPIYRDTTPGNIITYSVGKNQQALGGQCYFHRAGENSMSVDNWSEGCQVFQNSKHWRHFMDMCKIHVQKNGNSFTYTLMEERDLQTTKAEIDAEILAAQQKSAELAKNNNQSQTTSENISQEISTTTVNPNNLATSTQSTQASAVAPNIPTLPSDAMEQSNGATPSINP
jgi:Trp operon repressor